MVGRDRSGEGWAIRGQAAPFWGRLDDGGADCPVLGQAEPLGRNVHWLSFTDMEDAPLPAIVQRRVDARSERSKPLVQLLSPKIRLICSPRIGDVSDIKLIRTDTTLDLSQKAEKR